MHELEHDLDRAVDALRAKRSPPAGTQAQVFALLEARLGAGGPGGGEAGGAAPGSSGAFAAKVVAATAAMTAGGLLVVKLGALTLHSLSSGAAPHVEPAPAQTQPVVEQRPAQSDPPANPETTSNTQATTPAVLVPKQTTKRAAGSVAQPSPEPPEPDISAELRLIEAARQAASPSAVIVELAEHARQFPSGTLSDERDALWAIASCERDDLDDAARRARAVAGRRPNSPLLERIAAACPGLSKK